MQDLGPAPFDQPARYGKVRAAMLFAAKTRLDPGEHAQGVEFQLALIDDWIADEVTTEVLNLMPTWVRWLGEGAGLPDHLRERVIAAAAPRSSDATARTPSISSSTT